MSGPDTTDRRALLDHLSWHALTGAQACHAAGHGGARRYAPGFSPIVAFADVQRPDFDALTPCCAPDEQVYCEGWSGTAPAHWRIDAETTMFKMLWHGAAPGIDNAPEAVLLGPRHVAQAQALAGLTQPGPFGPRTVELSEYFGCFDGDRLLAMAGERMHAGTLREISGVCTHPQAQGRGFARRLMLKLVGRELARGETPCLHVMRDNVHARSLYERMGFAVHGETVVRVMSRIG